MDIQICTLCDYPMEDSRYGLCWTCWRKTQGYKRIKSDERYENLQVIIQKLLEEEAPPESQQLKELREKNNHIKQANDRLALEVVNLKVQLEKSKGLEPSLLKKLIQFCHPDRNQGRTTDAEELTKTLLSMRKK